MMDNSFLKRLVASLLSIHIIRHLRIIVKGKMAFFRAIFRACKKVISVL